MEIILGILFALLFISLVVAGFFVRAWHLLNKKMKKWETEKKAEFLELSRTKVIAEKEVKRLKQKVLEIEASVGINDLKLEINSLTMKLVDAEMEIEKREKMVGIIQEGYVPIKKTILLEIKETVLSLFRRSNDISYRENGKKIILAIDEGLGDSVSFKVVK